MWMFASSQSIILPLCQIFFAVSVDELGWDIKLMCAPLRLKLYEEINEIRVNKAAS